MSIESVMPYNHLIHCHPLPLPSIFPSIRVFSNQSVLHITWPKYWSFSSASVHPMNSQDWFPSGPTSLISLQPSYLHAFVWAAFSIDKTVPSYLVILLEWFRCHHLTAKKFSTINFRDNYCYFFFCFSNIWNTTPLQYLSEYIIFVYMCFPNYSGRL